MPGEQVVYRPTPVWLRRLRPVAVVLAVGQPLAAWLVTGRVGLSDVLMAALVVVALGALRLVLRPQLVVDRDGLDLPRRGRQITWREVDHVRVPGPWDAVVVLVLTDGREQRTTYPIDLAEKIAAVGAVPLR